MVKQSGTSISSTIGILQDHNPNLNDMKFDEILKSRNVQGRTGTFIMEQG